MERRSYKQFSREFLGDIQGNILQAHKRKHARHLFITFGENDDKQEQSILSWIRDFGNSKANSCWSELESNRETFFYTLLLTAAGYEALDQNLPDNEAFRGGMEARGALLKDIEKDDWQTEYRKTEIHAMIILADNDPVALAIETVALKEGLLKANGSVITEEQGSRLTRFGQEIEHFGFVDGISQPEEVGEIVEYKNETICNPDQLLAKDPYGGYGSYMVYRKLEQNVKLWEDNVQDLAKLLDVSPFLTGAFSMGRYKDGTPVVGHTEMRLDLEEPELTQVEPENDFDYSADPEGNQCPYHSHMRKMNTRSDSNFPRIARRALSYGVRPDFHPQGKLFALPEHGAGLLFMCFQKDIEEGFEFLQKAANDPDFPEKGVGQDPLISQGEGEEINGKWPKEHGSSERVDFSFNKTITLKGGAYFFAPSIKFLKNIS